MIRSTPTTLVLLAAFFVAAGASAQDGTPAAEVAADQAVGIFFDQMAAAAEATVRDKEDDARVDRWLWRCAVLSGGTPEVQAALYARLIERAQQRRGGEAEALDHLLALAKAQPGHRRCSLEQRVAFYGSAYEAAPRSQREPLVEPYIELLIESAQQHERAWEIDAALDAQREALSVARSARSPYREVLEDYGRSLAGLARSEQHLEQLRREAATDAQAARSLAVRLAAERSDFAGAIDAADQAGEAELVSLLLLAAQPVQDIEPMQVLAVAEMFRALADDPALDLEVGKLRTLQEAQFYYQHFLFVYGQRDVVRLTAAETAAQLSPRIEALRPEPIRRPAGPWRALAGGITEPRVGNDGNLVYGRHLRVRNSIVYAHRSAFTVPVEVDDSYDFRMAITLTHANEREGMSLYFPIGGRRGGRLVLGDGGDTSCRFEGLDPIERLARFRFPEDRPVAMVLGVHPVPGNSVHLTLTLDGTEVFNWTGPIRNLHVHDRDRPPLHQGNIFRIGAGTTYEFQQLEVRRAAEE
ncbi:hypothetical protein OT109_07410 [Phycisphaeraceae bacterium D3-23]